MTAARTKPHKPTNPTIAALEARIEDLVWEHDISHLDAAVLLIHQGEDPVELGAFIKRSTILKSEIARESAGFALGPARRSDRMTLQKNHRKTIKNDTSQQKSIYGTPLIFLT